MRTRELQCFALLMCMAVFGSAARAGTAEKASRSTTTAGSRRQAVAPCKPARPSPKSTWRKRGQQAITASRVRQIQAALVRENYLQGRPTGVWDQRSKTAMARFQSDNHWQSTIVPDSRALMKLGLGPDYAGLLNPATASISFVPRPGALPGAAPSQR